MMRKSLIYNILGAFFMLIALSSCYDQDVEAPQSTDTYPIATFTTDFTGSEIMEGETIDYTITLDRMLDHDITFTVHSSGVADDHDFSFEPVTIPAYTKTGQISVAFAADNIPEDGEALNLEFGVFDLGTQYTINPKTVYPNLDLTVVNKNDDSGVTVAFGWVDPDPDHGFDFDLFLIHETDGDWGLAGSSANPETMSGVIASDDIDGKYYVTVDPYSAEGIVDYTIAIGYPDQTVAYYTGTFDVENKDTYPTDYFAYWGMDTYRVLTIEKTGTSYTVTQ